MKITFYDPDDDKKEAKRKLTKPTRRGKKGHFTLDWVSELGWKRNPFQMNNPEIAGMEDERQELNLFFIKKKHFGVVLGDEGSGKTILMKWLVKELDNYKGIDAHYLDLATATTEKKLMTLIADPFRGFFKRGDSIKMDDLVELISRKSKGRFVLLLDNAQKLNVAQTEVLKDLLQLDCSIICATSKKLSKPPARNELGLTLKKRTAEDAMRILKERVKEVGGKGIHPFTQKVIAKMSKQSNSTRQFLDLAQETAINIALKKVVLEEDVSEDLIADEEEEKVARKKGLKKDDTRSPKRRKYDELIEGLTTDMDD